MLIAPEIFITTQAAATDHSALLLALVTPAVTLGLFYLAQREARRKDSKDLESHREKERETLRLNLKRDVFLEVAPAIQNNYSALIQSVDLKISTPDLQRKFQDTLAKSGDGIAKLQAFASDDTIEAARQVQTTLGAIYIRLLADRIALGERKDLDAVKEMARAWRREADAYPPVISTLIYHARLELHLPFDKEQFEHGFVDSNTRMFAELERFIGPLG
ncbi:hypothetical protein [Rhodanobacter sp. L36]|uniref:hypothetical protein n=1 Tax=Rhodanobacter sp. L36 TaxID=1747221 RepID=UPI00131B8FEE|nr:hypothetical protein [Rhodanobacter sp. L36]